MKSQVTDNSIINVLICQRMNQITSEQDWFLQPGVTLVRCKHLGFVSLESNPQPFPLSFVEPIKLCHYPLPNLFKLTLLWNRKDGLFSDVQHVVALALARALRDHTHTRGGPRVRLLCGFFRWSLQNSACRDPNSRSSAGSAWYLLKTRVIKDREDRYQYLGKTNVM